MAPSPTAPGSTSTPSSRPGQSTATASCVTSGSRSTVRAELHGLPVDVLVPGARVGIYDAAVAADVQAKVISPAANVPYTAAGLDVLRRNHVVALPDFVCNGGAVLAYQAPRGLNAVEVLGRVDRLISERIEAAKLTKMDPIRHATVMADTFLTTWIPAEHRPAGPAVAPEPIPGR